MVATFVDATGTMELVWFPWTKWLKDSLKLNEPYVVYGKLNHYKGKFSIPHPEIETLSNYKKKFQSAMQPVYPSTEKLTNAGVTNKLIRTYVHNLLQQFFEQIGESLSTELTLKHQLIGKREALLNIHFPKSQERFIQCAIPVKV